MINNFWLPLPGHLNFLITQHMITDQIELHSVLILYTIIDYVMYLIFYSFLHWSKMHWHMWTISNKVTSWTKHSTRKVKPFLGKEHIICYMGYASNTKNNKDHENNSCQLHYSCHQKINGLSNILLLKCSLKSGSVSQQSFRHSRQNKGNYSCLIKK